MKIDELKDRLAKVSEAEKKAFETMLASSKQEDVEKVNSLGKLKEEYEAQLEALESRQAPPTQNVAPATLSEKQKWAKAFCEAVSTSGNFSGGMPQEMATEVMQKVLQTSTLLSRCKVEKLTSDMSITVETGLPTVAYVAEGAVIGDTSPATKSVVLSAKKLGCIAKVSQEVIKDVSFDIVAYVIDVIGRAIGSMLVHEVIQGTGTNAIEGVLSNTSINKTTSKTTKVVTWTEVKAMLTSLKGYKAGCTLVMSQEIADMIHDFTDGSGNYIFPQNEELTAVKGHPVEITDQMPAIAAGKALVLAGNFQYYALGKRDDVEITTLYERYADTDQVGIKAVVRVDGKVGQAEAFAAIISA